MNKMLKKYFDGHQKALSMKLLMDALSLHFEGISAESREMLSDGLVYLLSELGKEEPQEVLFGCKIEPMWPRDICLKHLMFLE